MWHACASVLHVSTQACHTWSVLWENQWICTGSSLCLLLNHMKLFMSNIHSMETIGKTGRFGSKAFISCDEKITYAYVCMYLRMCVGIHHPRIHHISNRNGIRWSSATTCQLQILLINKDWEKLQSRSTLTPEKIRRDRIGSVRIHKAVDRSKNSETNKWLQIETTSVKLESQQRLQRLHWWLCK